MRFSVVLFDLDGTLIDTNHLIVHTFQHVLKQELGLDVAAEELFRYFGEPLPVTLARWCPDRAEELTDLYRVYNLANHDRLLRQFEGMREALIELRQCGVKLAVVTSKKVATAQRGLQISCMDEFFDAVVGMDETDKHKPDPEPALLALDRLSDAAGKHVLMVGDSRFDILCGRNAGLSTAAVGWTVQSREELSLTRPDFWIESPASLVDLVLGR